MLDFSSEPSRLSDYAQHVLVWAALVIAKLMNDDAFVVAALEVTLDTLAAQFAGVLVLGFLHFSISIS